MANLADDFVLLDWEDAVDPQDPDSSKPPKHTADQIKKWLEPTAYDAYGSEFNKHADSHLQGTGSWITRSSEFEEWHTSDSRGVLWLKGIPGSGKSVIAASLIPLLAKEGFPVVHFFFRQIIAANHEPAALLRDWMVQLLPSSPALQTRLSRYMETQRDLKTLSLNDMWKYLRTGLVAQSKVYCIVDGLDEMDRGHDEFVKQLAMLGCWRPSQLKVLLTSRPVPDIETSLRSIPKLELRLDADHVDSDIARYVRHRLKGLGFSQSDEELVKRAVPGRASGIFIYAKLAMDAFDVPGANPTGVVKQLPLDINHMYDSLLQTHAERAHIPPAIQREILEWATHATRPLRLLELAEMLRTTEDICKSQDIKQTKELVIRTCGPLLELLTDERISVAHHSLTEFLKGSSRSTSALHYPVFDACTTHAKLAIKCITYLVSGCLDGMKPQRPQKTESILEIGRMGDPVEVTTLRTNHAFFAYAAQNWYIHAAKAQRGEGVPEALRDAINKFFSSDIFAAWTSIHGPSFDASPLHVLAWAGLDEYALGWLQTSRAELDLQDVKGDTPMHMCARQGHAATVALLLRNGAQPDVDNAVGLKPLHNAAQHGHAEVARVLMVDGKVDPLTPKTKETVVRRCGNMASSIGHTPLMYACQAGHAGVVKVLTTVDNVQRALIWAAESSHANVVRVLLENDQIVVDDRSTGSTAMFIASSKRDIQSMEALLGRGADPNLLARAPLRNGSFVVAAYSPYDERDRLLGMTSPVHVYCNPSERTYTGQSHLDPSEVRRGLAVLHRAGADLLALDGSGLTPLHHACHSKTPGVIELVRYLVENGASINARCSAGMTPLFGCTDQDVVRYLCERGADPNVRRHNDHKTPLLHLFDQSSHVAQGLPITALIQAGASTSVSDENGNTPLHLAVQSWYLQDAAAALLETGALVNARNHSGETPLFMAVTKTLGSNAADLVKLLVDHGADLEQKDNRGRTALYRAVEADSHEYGLYGKPMWQMLLDAGADIHSTDFRLRNLFLPLVMRQVRQNAQPNRNRDLFGSNDYSEMSLNDLGVKPQADVEGNTPFHVFAQQINNHSHWQSWFEPVIETLLAHNVHPGQANYSRWTPLHDIVSVTRQSDLMYAARFIELGNNIDARDERGVTPLHVACTISEGLSALLLYKGANSQLATYEGLTVLHLSARGKQSNVLAMAIENMREQDTLKSMVDARDKKGRTPLHHACRSGLYESVALLLDAGADPMAEDSTNLTPLDACAEYEAEQALWEESPRYGDSFVAVRAAGFSLLDTRRPCADTTDGFSDRSVGATRLSLVRDGGLEDIVSLLIERSPQGQVEQLKAIAYRVINLCEATGRHYTFGVFVDLAAMLGRPNDPGFLGSASPEREFLRAQYHAAGSVMQERVASTDWLTRLEFRHLIELRRHDVIRGLISEGKLDLTTPDDCGNTALHFIVMNGLVGLLTSFCQSPARNAFDSKKFYEACCATRNPFARKGPLGLMMAAAERPLPNLRVLRLLHEELGIDINEKSNPTAEDGAEKSDRAIHLFAEGRHFWHVSQGLPYLLQTGAAVQVVNVQGDTPLHKALSTLEEEPERYPVEAVNLLLEAGADVSVLNTRGESCLSGIIAHPSLLESLLGRKGVIVTADAVFAAIEAGNVDALQALLQARPDIVHERRSDTRQDQTRPQPTPHNIGDWEYSALHFAATCPWFQDRQAENVPLEKYVRIVELLLDYGADPFATFVYQPNVRHPTLLDYDDDSDFDNQPAPPPVPGTVLHAIIQDGGIVEPFLQRGLNVEHCDQHGRTLLLAACSSRLGPDADVNSVRWMQSMPDVPQRTIFQDLSDLRADITTLDNQGRNALHLLATRSDNSSYFPRFEASMRLLCERHPQLMTQTDHAGNTALFASLASGGQGLKTASSLIECGSDVSALDTLGNSVLHAIASHIGLADAEDEAMQLFRQLLLQPGLDVNARNNAGETPLAIYIQNFHINTHSLFGTFFKDKSKPEESSSADPPVVSALKTFITLGADPLAVTSLQNHNLLHLLAKRPGGDWAENRFGDLDKHLRIAWRYLWKGVGVDPYMEDVAGRTAWDLVVASGAEVSKLDGEGSEDEKRETYQDGGGDWDDDLDL